MLYGNISSLTLMIGGSEVIIIAAIVLLLFGGKKIPELMKSMGQGVRSFKKGMEEEEHVPTAHVVDNEVKLPEEDKQEKT